MFFYEPYSICITQSSAVTLLLKLGGESFRGFCLDCLLSGQSQTLFDENRKSLAWSYFNLSITRRSANSFIFWLAISMSQSKTDYGQPLADLRCESCHGTAADVGWRKRGVL